MLRHTNAAARRGHAAAHLRYRAPRSCCGTPTSTRLQLPRHDAVIVQEPRLSKARHRNLERILAAKMRHPHRERALTNQDNQSPTHTHQRISERHRHQEPPIVKVRHRYRISARAPASRTRQSATAMRVYNASKLACSTRNGCESRRPRKLARLRPL